MSNEQQTQQADDPSGPGWRDVEVGEVLRHTDMFRDSVGAWVFTENKGLSVREDWDRTYRRRIEPQPSDSEPEPDNDDDIERAVEELENNMTVTLLDAAQQRCRELDADLRTAEQQNAELSALLAEADRGGQQVNAELQQLRQQVQTLTADYDRTKCQLWDAVEARQKAERELKDKNDTYQLCLQNHYKAGQRSAIDKLQAWLRPVLEVVAEHPDHTSILAVSVLEFLPQIASRLIEE